MAQSLKIKLVRSAVASVKKDQTNPSIRGMIFKVKHLVVVEEN